MKIVVCGGGIAGSYLVNQLAHESNKRVESITLVEPKTYFEATNGMIGAMHDPSYESEIMRVTIPGRKAWHKRVRHVQARIVSVQDKSVTLSDGPSLDFDVLCLAMGSRTAPGCIWRPQEDTVTRSERLIEVMHHRKQIEEAKTVVVVGGGVVGVEMTSELAARFPKVQFHLAVAEKNVLWPFPRIVRIVALRHLKGIRNVHVHLNMGKIEVPADNVWTNLGTKKGNNEPFKADVVLRCYSAGVNTSCVPPEWLDQRKQVKVNEYLQVESNPSIFAIGDMTNATHDKSAKAALQQAEIALANIIALTHQRGDLPRKFTNARKGVMIKLGPGQALAYKNSLMGYYGLTFSGALMSELVRQFLLWQIIGQCTGRKHFFPPFPKYLPKEDDSSPHTEVVAITGAQ